MTLAVEICYRLAKWRVLRRDGQLVPGTDASSETIASHGAGANPFAFDRGSYAQWRDESLKAQFVENFDCAQLAGKRVLDFGCGTGYLSKLASSCGAVSVDGLDLNEPDIVDARRSFGADTGAAGPRFHVATNARTIDFKDACFDVILCFDVVEHVMDYQSIVREWKRVLSPGGRILIWWQPYFHPWGHHCASGIPIPWAHVLFSNETLAEVDYRIAQLPEYKPRYWELDSEGNRIVLPKADPETFADLNRLTIRDFEQLCRACGLRIARREAHAFQGPLPVRILSGLLSKIPRLNEYFTAYLIYEIENPGR